MVVKSTVGRMSTFCISLKGSQGVPGQRLQSRTRRVLEYIDADVSSYAIG